MRCLFEPVDQIMMIRKAKTTSTGDLVQLNENKTK